MNVVSALRLGMNIEFRNSGRASAPTWSVFSGSGALSEELRERTEIACTRTEVAGHDCYNSLFHKQLLRAANCPGGNHVLINRPVAVSVTQAQSQ
jgi:hypothetical protein